jgi:L,D-transpeptidase catalytic domain
MGRELRLLLLLPVAGYVIAATIVIETRFARPSESESAPLAAVRDGWRRPPGYPKLDPAPPLPEGHLLAHIRPGRAVDVRTRPHGRVVATLGSRTEFGSERVLSVVRERRGRWLGVTTPQVPNGALGWLDARAGALRYSRSAVELEVDLSSRLLVVRQGERVLRRAPVSTGRADSSTPRGRFAVTDKLPGRRYSSVYGCCILALSGTQPSLPAGWRGGNRLAIHGTPDQSSVGNRGSAGCLHARTRDLRWLMSSVPLGAPVRIHL